MLCKLILKDYIIKGHVGAHATHVENCPQKLWECSLCFMSNIGIYSYFVVKDYGYFALPFLSLILIFPDPEPAGEQSVCWRQTREEDPKLIHGFQTNGADLPVSQRS